MRGIFRPIIDFAFQIFTLSLSASQIICSAYIYYYTGCPKKKLSINLTVCKLTLLCGMYLELYTSKKNPISHIWSKFQAKLFNQSRFIRVYTIGRFQNPQKLTSKIATGLSAFKHLQSLDLVSWVNHHKNHMEVKQTILKQTSGPRRRHRRLFS